MRSRAGNLLAGWGVAGILFTQSAPAQAATAHTVLAGESTWSIAAASNFTTRTIEVFNGLPAGAVLVEGQTIMVPSEAEGASALAAAGLLGTPVEETTATATSTSTSAPSAGGHTVVWGESLSSIAAANGITTSALASYNGLAEDGILVEGSSLQIPAATSATTVSASSPTAGLGHVPSPYGELHLDPAAADSWNAMREEGLATYGVDIYPGGPLSAYRTYEQQAELYELYLSGQGAPANPPGSSSHETGLAVDLEAPEMRSVIDGIGAAYGWGKTEAPDEWWHVNYFGG